MNKSTGDGHKAEYRLGVCDCCGFETWIKECDVGPPGEGVTESCDVCAGTWISNVCEHPGNYVCDVALYRSLGYVANMILNEVSELFERAPGARVKPPPTEAEAARKVEGQKRWDQVARALSRLYEVYYKRPMQVSDLTEWFLAVEVRDALEELMEAYDAWLD